MMNRKFTVKIRKCEFILLLCTSALSLHLIVLVGYLALNSHPNRLRVSSAVSRAGCRFQANKQNDLADCSCIHWVKPISTV